MRLRNEAERASWEKSFHRSEFPFVAGCKGGEKADGAVSSVTTVNGADLYLETAALIRKLMTERGLPVPPPNRVLESICVVSICQERVWK